MSFLSTVKNLLSSEGFQKYFKNTSWLMLEKFIEMGVAFFIGVYVARFLGPSDFGILSYARSFAMFFIIFSQLGLESIMTRNLINHPEQKEKLLGTAWWLRVTSSSLCLLAYLVVMPFVPHTETLDWIIILVLAGNIIKSFAIINWHFQGQVLASYPARARFIQVIILSLIKLYLIYIEAPLLWFAGVVFIEDLLISISFIIIYEIRFGRVTSFIKKFSLSYAKDVLSDSWPLILSSFVTILYMKIDQVMIKNMMDNAAVGNYSVAVKLSEIWYFIGSLACGSLFPAILNAKKRDYNLYMQRVRGLYDLFVWLGLCITIPMTFLGPWLIQLLYGIEYQAAGGVLVIQVWAVIFVFLGAASYQYLVAENLQKVTLYRTVMGAITNIGLNFLLIPRMGIEGAAWATLVSQAVASYLGYAITKETRSVFTDLTKSLLLISSVSTFKRLIAQKRV